jgi:hypothetical protein
MKSGQDMYFYYIWDTAKCEANLTRRDFFFWSGKSQSDMFVALYFCLHFLNKILIFSK